MSEITEIIELLNEGKSLSYIIRKLDIPRTTLENKIMKQTTVIDNKYVYTPCKHITVADAMKLKEDIKKEEGSIKEICTKYHISRYVYNKVISS